MTGIFGMAGRGRRAAAPAAVLALGIAAAAAAASDARAADARWGDGRWYAGLAVPVMFIDDTESTTTGSQSLGQPPAIAYSSKSTSEYETGFKVAGTVSKASCSSRGRRSPGVTYKGVNAAGNAIPLTVEIPVSGTADQFGAFASAWYDFRTGTDWIPYVGGGLGFIRVDQGGLDYDSQQLFRDTVAALRAANPVLPDPERLPAVPEISTTETVFAYHVGIGTGYRLSDNVILQAGYRFQTAEELEFEGRNAAGSVNVTSGLRIHLLEIGVRYRF